MNNKQQKSKIKRAFKAPIKAYACCRHRGFSIYEAKHYISKQIRKYYKQYLGRIMGEY